MARPRIYGIGFTDNCQCRADNLMPFTLFHMGPGLAVKAVCGRHFSLTVFGFSQVAMDIEPLVRILRGDHILHGWTHTYAGATLIALVSLLVGRPVCRCSPKGIHRIFLLDQVSLSIRSTSSGSRRK